MSDNSERIAVRSDQRIAGVPAEPGSARAALIAYMREAGYSHRVAEERDLTGVPLRRLSRFWGPDAERYILPISGVVRLFSDQDELEREYADAGGDLADVVREVALFDVFERGLEPAGETFQARTDRRRREATRGYAVEVHHVPAWAEPSLLDGGYAALTNETAEHDGVPHRAWDVYRPAPEPDGSTT